MLTAGLGAVTVMPACGTTVVGYFGVEACCDADAGAGAECNPSCHGVQVNPGDGGDSGVMGFFVPDAGDAGPDAGDAGMIVGTVTQMDGGTDAG